MSQENGLTVKIQSRRCVRYGVIAALLVAPVWAFSSLNGAHGADSNQTKESKTVDARLLIVGGSESACAAAIQAARMGIDKIVLVNDVPWLGGQFSAEGLLAIDENRGPSGYGHGVPFPRNGLFKEAIDRIEAKNKKKYGHPRPGNTRVITTCRPSDAAEVFSEMLAPYVKSGQVRVIDSFYPTKVLHDVSGKMVQGVEFTHVDDESQRLTVQARLTIDSSDWGDVIRLSGAEYEFGPDLKSKYGEPLAPVDRKKYPVTDMNAITYCMVINETDRYEPIAKPAGYDVRNYNKHPYPQDPLWLYASRRVIDRYNLPEVTHPDVVLLCFPAFDYPLDVLPGPVQRALEADEPGASRKNIVEMTRPQRQIVFDDAKRHSLGFLYYLQTDVHDRMPDKTHSFRRFELTDEFGTPDRMPMKPYVRESLRMKAMYMMRQQDTMPGGPNGNGYARVMYYDGIGCWQFEYDFHPTGRKFLANGDIDGPWQGILKPLRKWGPPYSGRALLPARSFVPEEIDGLLAAQKSIGFSSIVSSAVRLHDQSMAVGQAAGAMAGVCLKNDITPRSIPQHADMLGAVRRALCARIDGGVPHSLWPFRDLDPKHPAFEAANLLAVSGCLPLGLSDVDFRAEDAASSDWQADVVAATATRYELPAGIRPPSGELTRGAFVRQWWDQVKDLPPVALQRKANDDADADGIVDRDDAAPYGGKNASLPLTRLTPERDGIPDDLPADRRVVLAIDFVGPGANAAEGFQPDHGAAWSEQRGFGWERDLAANHRRRGRFAGQARDSFVFTRAEDVWKCQLPAGEYRVTLCIGDSGHEQVGQNVAIAGTQQVEKLDTPEGVFREITVPVTVADEPLVVRIGANPPTGNTCLNWLRITQAK